MNLQVHRDLGHFGLTHGIQGRRGEQDGPAAAGQEVSRGGGGMGGGEGLRDWTVNVRGPGLQRKYVEEKAARLPLFITDTGCLKPISL